MTNKQQRSALQATIVLVMTDRRANPRRGPVQLDQKRIRTNQHFSQGVLSRPVAA
jgi:hypothetical protein